MKEKEDDNFTDFEKLCYLLANGKDNAILKADSKAVSVCMNKYGTMRYEITGRSKWKGSCFSKLA